MPFPVKEDITAHLVYQVSMTYTLWRWRVYFRMVSRVPALRVTLEHPEGTVKCDSGYVNGVATTSSSSNYHYRPSCTWSYGGYPFGVRASFINNALIFLEYNVSFYVWQGATVSVYT